LRSSARLSAVMILLFKRRSAADHGDGQPLEETQDTNHQPAHPNSSPRSVGMPKFGAGDACCVSSKGWIHVPELSLPDGMKTSRVQKTRQPAAVGRLLPFSESQAHEVVTAQLDGWELPCKELLTLGHFQPSTRRETAASLHTAAVRRLVLR
jgi:hypothetical protein